MLRPVINRYLALLAVLCVFSPAAPAAELWYEDNNLGKAGGMPADFARKFGQPGSFRQAARHIRVYLVRANVLARMDDRFLGAVFFPWLEKNGIRLAVDAAGATWAQAQGREKAGAREIELLARVKRLGARVDYISLQSVLSKPLPAGGREADYPLRARIEDAAAYAKAARAVYPDAAIGIIDALPSHGKDYRQPYRLLKEAFAREGLELSYIHLDMPFEIPRLRTRGIAWQTIREVESYVENDLGLRFGLYATTALGGHTSSKAFHEGVMAALECYAGAGGTPGEFIIASWFPHPRDTIPETASGDDYPAMRTALAFGRRLESMEKAGPSRTAQRPQQPEWRALCAA